MLGTVVKSLFSTRYLNLILAHDLAVSVLSTTLFGTRGIKHNRHDGTISTAMVESFAADHVFPLQPHTGTAESKPCTVSEQRLETLETHRQHSSIL